MADEQVGLLHALRRGDPAVSAMATRLGEAAGPAFTERWARRLVPEPLGRGHVLDHPDVGPLRLTTEVLEVPVAHRDHQRVVVHLPADDAAAGALDRLAGRVPGGLRAVGG